MTARIFMALYAATTPMAAPEPSVKRVILENDEKELLLVFIWKWDFLSEGCICQPGNSYCIVVFGKNSFAVGSCLRLRIRPLVYSYVSIVPIGGMSVMIFIASVKIIFHPREICKGNISCIEISFVIVCFVRCTSVCCYFFYYSLIRYFKH